MNQSELILNADGSIYHLNLLPQDVAQNIIFVGDPDRVAKVSQHFDTIEVKKQKREFVTHTGFLNSKRITVISTGIGIGNIEIVMNELDALFNIDFEKKEIKNAKTSLNIMRIGTSGSLHPEIQPDDILLSKAAVGIDGMMNFYPDHKESNDPWFSNFKDKFPYPSIAPFLYYGNASQPLMEYFKDVQHLGITGTLPGFYAPQGRKLRLSTLDENILEQLNALGLTNFEMETATIYAFAKLLGHQAVSINAILANRRLGTFAKNPKESEKKLISWAIERIAKF